MIQCSIEQHDDRNMALSNLQIRNLRAESHRLKLKPVVMIGQHGLSESVMNELESSIQHHELIKVRIPALEKTDKKTLIQSMCEQLEAEEIQNIGHVVVLFRQNPKSKRPESQNLAKLLK